MNAMIDGIQEDKQNNNRGCFDGIQWNMSLLWTTQPQGGQVLCLKAHQWTSIDAKEWGKLGTEQQPE